MSDPIIDEDGIILLLRASVTPDNVNAIQAGAIQAMIDLYDRKVTREEFCEMLAPCLALYGQTAKLWLLHNIYSVHKDGNLDDERFQKAATELTAVISKQVDSVVEIVSRVKQCPTSKDKVH
jgi:hypothetical protein